MDYSGLKIPNHVAIIVDGNGRWAKKRGLPRNMGHRQGGKTVELICEEAYKLGIKYVTLYAFSTENWKRPKDEVDAIMKLLKDYLVDAKNFKDENIKVKFIGDLSALTDSQIMYLSTLLLILETSSAAARSP